MRTTVVFIACCLVAGWLPAEEPAKVTYDDHVRPILRQHCFTCHNQNEKKGGLALDTYPSVIEGGAGGEIVFDGDSSSSRLWMLMAHEDTPIMPPDQDKLADEITNVVKYWIDGGLLENSGSTAKKKKTNKLAFSASADGKPDGPAAMPEQVWQQPVMVTERLGATTAIRCSPWAPLVAIAGQHQVVLYNTDNGEFLGVLPFPEGDPQSLTFSRDGSYLLVGGGWHSNQGMAALYDVRTGDRVATVGDELDTVLGSDINESLSRVALGGPQRLVRIHDVASGEKLFELKKHTDWVYSVKYSPDGVLVASGDRAGGLVLWEADTGRLYLDLVGHKDAIRSIAWRADSNVVASASMDGTVKMWEIFNGGQIKSFNAHGGGVTGIDMARDGRMVTSGKDRLVKLWDANGNAVRDFPAFPEAVLEVSFSHDGSSVIAGDWTGLVKMWKTDDPTQEMILSPNPAKLETRLDSARQLAATKRQEFEQSEAALKAAQDQLAAVTNQVQTLTEQVTAAKAAAETAEVERVAAAAALQQANTSVDQLNQQHASNAAAAAEEAKKLAALITTRDAANEELKQGEQARLQALAARDAVAAEIKTVDDQLAQIQGTDEAANSQRTELLNKRNPLGLQHQQQSQAFEAAVQKSNEAAAKLKAAVDALPPLQQSLATTQATLGQHQVALATARETLRTSTQTAAASTAKAEQTKANVANLEQQLTTVQQQVAPLTEARDQAQQTANTATAARDASASQVANLESDLANFQAARTTLTSAEATANQQLADVTAKIEQATQAAADVAGKMSSTDEQLAALTQQLQALQAQLEQLKASKQELDAQQAQAAEEAATLEAQVQQLTERRSLFEAAYGTGQ